MKLRIIGEVVLVSIALALCLGWGLIRGYALNWICPLIKKGGLL